MKKKVSNKKKHNRKHSYGKMIMIILVCLLVGIIVIICNNKSNNAEKPPVPKSTAEVLIDTPTVPKPTSEVLIDTPTDNNGYTTLEMVKLVNENRNVIIGDNVFTVFNKLESKYVFINDKEIYDENGKNVSADLLYIIDNFAFFTRTDQVETIIYAIDSNGNKIKVQDNGYYIREVRLEDGLVVCNGMKIADAVNGKGSATEKELVIKYENNVVTIEPKK